MDAWAYAHNVRLEFIRPVKPVENAFIESFNGRLRDECLNVHVFASTSEAQQVLDAWRRDYNQVRPHSALQDRTPAEMGALWVDSRDARESTAVREDGIETEITGPFVTISPVLNSRDGSVNGGPSFYAWRIRGGWSAPSPRGSQSQV